MAAPAGHAVEPAACAHAQPVGGLELVHAADEGARGVDQAEGEVLGELIAVELALHTVDLEQVGQVGAEGEAVAAARALSEVLAQNPDLTELVDLFRNAQ